MSDFYTFWAIVACGVLTAIDPVAGIVLVPLGLYLCWRLYND